MSHLRMGSSMSMLRGQYRCMLNCSTTSDEHLWTSPCHEKKNRLCLLIRELFARCLFLPSNIAMKTVAVPTSRNNPTSISHSLTYVHHHQWEMGKLHHWAKQNVSSCLCDKKCFVTCCLLFSPCSLSSGWTQHALELETIAAWHCVSLPESMASQCPKRCMRTPMDSMHRVMLLFGSFRWGAFPATISSHYKWEGRLASTFSGPIRSQGEKHVACDSSTASSGPRARGPNHP